MTYTIKPEYWPLWGNEVNGFTIVTDEEIADLAREWDKDIIELMEQVEECETGTVSGMTAEDIIRRGLYDAAVNLMDDDLREEVHEDLAPCTELEFLSEYIKRHEEKHGMPFEF